MAQPRDEGSQLSGTFFSAGLDRTLQGRTDQFETLESDGGVRRHQLDLVIERSGPQRLALVCVDPASCPEQGTLEQALAGGAPLTLSMARPLNGADGTRTWPKALHEQDLILFSLAAPRWRRIS